MRPNNNPLFTSQVATSNQSSTAQWSDNIVRASFQLVATGTVSGTIQAQASNDQAYGSPPNQFQPTNWNNLGTTVALSGSGSYLVPEFECSYEYLRLVYLNTVAGVQTVAPIADTGSLQHQTVTTVADVSGSLNNTYLLLSSVNTSTKAQKNFYIWFNINSAGVDPLIAGRTAIPITGATNVSANTLATSIRSALNALTGDFTATGSGAAVIVNDVAFGPVTAAVDGAAPTGFTFGSATLGVTSNLNNKYFLLQDEASTHLFYVWLNVDSIGTAPAPSGRTAIEVDFASGSTAGTIGTAMATAVAAANSSGSFTTSGTTTVSITNVTVGPYIPASDISTGFAFGVTTPSGTVSARIKSMGL